MEVLRYQIHSAPMSAYENAKIVWAVFALTAKIMNFMKYLLSKFEYGFC